MTFGCGTPILYVLSAIPTQFSADLRVRHTRLKMLPALQHSHQQKSAADHWNRGLEMPLFEWLSEL